MDTPATIVDSVLAGAYDEHLEALKTAISKRLVTLRSTRTIDDYMIGDRVRFNDYCGTQYLRDRTAVIVGRRRTKLSVVLDDPVGRFVRVENGMTKSAVVTVPPSIIDKVS